MPHPSPHTAYPQPSSPPPWAHQPGAAVPPQHGAPGIPAFTPPQVDPGILAIGPVSVAVPFVVGLLLVLIEGSNSTLESFGNPFQRALTFVGMAFGAPLEADTGVGGLSVTVPVPIALALSFGLALWWSRRLERRKPSTSARAAVAAALVPGAIAGLLTMALTFFGRISEGSGLNRVTTGAHPLLGFLGALFWVSLAAILGRWTVVGSPKPLADKLSPLAQARIRGSARSVLTYAVLSAAAGSLMLLIYGLTLDVKTGLAAFVWLLPFGGMIATEFVGGVPLSGSGSGLGSSRTSRSELVTVVSPIIPPWVLVLALVPLAVLLAVGLRHGTMRQSSGRVDWRDSLMTGALLTAIYLPVNLYTKIDLNGGLGLFGGSVSGGIQAGLGFLMMFLAGALIPVIGTYVTPFVGALAAAVSRIRPNPDLPTLLPTPASVLSAPWGVQQPPYAAPPQYPSPFGTPPQAQAAPAQYPSPFGTPPQAQAAPSQAPWPPQAAPWASPPGHQSAQPVAPPEPSPHQEPQPPSAHA